MSKPVFYSISPVGTSTDMKVTANIVISSGVATLSVAQTGNIGAGCRINYNSTHCFIAPNRIGFDSGGTVEIKIGDKITGGTSSGTGIVRAVHLSSGSWSGGDAAGYIYFEKTSGTWQDNEQINRTKPSSSSNIATANGTLEGNIGHGDTKFVVLTATGGTPSDQTSTAVTNIYHEYASLSTWEAGFTDSSHLNTTDLTTNSIIMYACCYYDHIDQTADTTAVTIDFGTTGASGYVYIYALAGNDESINRQRHSGVWNSNKYYLSITHADAISAKELYGRFNGLQISVTLNYESNSGRCLLFVPKAGTGVLHLYNCILRETTDYCKTECISLEYVSGTNSYTSHIHDNIIYGYTIGSGIASADSDHISYIYNNTISNCDNGIYRSIGTATVKNCAVFNNTDDFNGVTAIDYCASDDGDGTNAVDWDNESTDWGNVFTDYSNEDFSLKNYTSTGAIIDQGTDLTADSNLAIWRDIVGNERGSSWDIGAFEYVSTSSSDDLTSKDIITGNPVLDSPTIGQVHKLTSADVISGAPVIDQPTIGQVHALVSSDIVTGNPVIDQPTLSEGTDNLTAQDITTGSSTINQPTIGQIHSLVSSDITAGTPEIDTSIIGQVHKLVSQGIEVGNPIIDQPTLSEDTNNLTAQDIVTGSPVVESPSIGQVHALGSANIETGDPEISNPALGVVSDNLTARDIVSGAPIIDHPDIGQVHALIASGITTGNPTIGQPEVDKTIYSTCMRITIVPLENRTTVVPGEDRTTKVSYENRTTIIPGEPENGCNT